MGIFFFLVSNIAVSNDELPVKRVGPFQKCFLYLSKFRRSHAPRNPNSVDYEQFNQLVAQFKESKLLVTNPRKIFKRLKKFLIKKLYFSESQATRRADQELSSMLLELNQKDPYFSGYDPMTLRLASDWNTHRKMSRTLDYISLRTDLKSGERAQILANVIHSIPLNAMFRAEYVPVRSKDGDPQKVGHLFAGDVDQVFIAADGGVYQNKGDSSFSYDANNVPLSDTAYKRKPGRTLKNLFNDYR